MFPCDGPHRYVIAVLCLAIFWAPAAETAENRIKPQLDSVERDLERSRERQAELSKAARKAERELRELKRRGVTLAREIHRLGSAVTRIRERLEALEKDETHEADRLLSRRAELGATLAALQRIARMPAATLVAVPRPPDATIRSAILLRAAVPQLRTEATQLAENLVALETLRRDIDAERLELQRTLDSLVRERAELAAFTARKLELLQSTRSAERQTAGKAARLAAKAGSLRELLESLSENRRPAPRPAAPPPQRVPAPTEDRTASLAPGSMVGHPLPAPGRIITGFGEKMPNGTISRGVSIITRASAPVISPKGGRVVFAGNFRGYGNLVIIELEDGGHTLISGMSRIDAQIGDDVLAGEPLGEMTPSTTEAPKLYFELRRRGQPVNPVPPEAARRNKVSG